MSAIAAAAAAATTEGDSGSVFTANCDGEIKEWGAGDGAFRQMTVLTVKRYKIEAISRK